jgi:hypothetical protein
METNPTTTHGQQISSLLICFSLNNVQANKGSLTGKMTQRKKYTNNKPVNLPSEKTLYLQICPQNHSACCHFTTCTDHELLYGGLSWPIQLSYDYTTPTRMYDPSRK